MKNYSIKISLITEDGEERSSTIITSKQMEMMKKYHTIIDSLDEIVRGLLSQENSTDEQG